MVVFRLCDWIRRLAVYRQKTLNRQMVGCEARAAGACPGQGFDYRRHAAVQLNEVSSLGLLNPGACIRVTVRVRIRGNSGACIEPTGCTRTTTHSKFTAHSLGHYSVVYTLAQASIGIDNQ